MPRTEITLRQILQVEGALANLREKLDIADRHIANMKQSIVDGDDVWWVTEDNFKWLTGLVPNIVSQSGFILYLVHRIDRPENFPDVTPGEPGQQ